jgi:hypothetical protein
MARAKMSVVPPGANGTTIRTGLAGQALCAQLHGAAQVAIKKVATCAIPVRDKRLFFLKFCMQMSPEVGA